MSCEVPVHAVLTRQLAKDDEQAKKAFINLQRFHGVNPKELSTQNMAFLAFNCLSHDGTSQDLEHLTFDSLLCDWRRL